MAQPTLKELFDGVLADLNAELDISIPLFGKIFLRALAAVQAGKLWLSYKFLALVQKNIFVDTADPESKGGTLERFGRIKLNRNPFLPVAGIYTVEVTGTIGATIKANTTFKSNDDAANPGKLFVLDVEKILVAETDSIVLRAFEGGIDSKLEIGDQLTATAPISNVNSIVTTLTEDTQPLAGEDIEDYRDKAIEAYRLEPQGGASSDYRIWSADAQGVRRVFPFAKTGFSNEINVFVEATIVDSIDGKGTPTIGILTEVEEVIEFDPDISRPLTERGRRPLGLFKANVEPIEVKTVDIEITNFIGLTPTIQQNIITAVSVLLDDIRPFVAGADVVEDKNDILSVNNLIFSVLEVIPNDTNFDTLTFKIDTVPVPVSQLFENGDIPFLGVIDFV